MPGHRFDVEALGNPAAEQGPLEDRQEGRDRFAAREGRVGNHAGGIVKQRDQVGLVAPAIVGVEHRRPVHDVAHPELVGGVVTEAAAVLARRPVARARHQAVATEEAMDGRRRERHVGGDALLGARGGDDERHAVGRVRLLQRAERVGDGLRQRAGVPVVGAQARLEAVEAGAAIGVEPIAQRLGSHVAARGAGDVVLAVGLVAQARVERAITDRQMEQIGDQAVAKQGDGVGVRDGIGWGHRSSSPQKRGERDPHRTGPARSAPIPCGAADGEPSRRTARRWNPSGVGSVARCGAAWVRSASNADGVTSATRTAASRASPVKRSGNSVTTARRARRTGLSRRRTQRTAEGSVMSGRRTSAAASTLRAVSTVATTCSIGSSSPGK